MRFPMRPSFSCVCIALHQFSAPAFASDATRLRCCTWTFGTLLDHLIVTRDRLFSPGHASICNRGVEPRPTRRLPQSRRLIWYCDQLTVHSNIDGRDFLIQMPKPAKQQGGNPLLQTPETDWPAISDSCRKTCTVTMSFLKPAEILIDRSALCPLFSMYTHQICMEGSRRGLPRDGCS